MRGIFKIREKHVTTTMDAHEVDNKFELRDVPWVQYFEQGYALHATYWHDDFGKPRSHGCINLAPIDAAQELDKAAHRIATAENVARGAAWLHDRGWESEPETFIHPFADQEVMAGHGGLGLELLEDVPDLARVLVPVGGGGLISGVASALKGISPGIEVIGVQSDGYALWTRSLEVGGPVNIKPETIADGTTAPFDAIRTIVEPYFYVFTFKMNTRHGPLMDRKLRQAISYAFDYEELQRVARYTAPLKGPPLLSATRFCNLLRLNDGCGKG